MPKRTLAIVLSTALLLTAGCGPRSSTTPPAPQRQESPAAQTPGTAAATPLHLATEQAPPLEGANPSLRVALAEHLGRSGQSLALLSAGAAPLTLSAADGRRWRSPTLSIRWLTQPLDAVLRIDRQQLGPFASFETAAAVAERLRSTGLAPLVAHPRDWVLWLPAAAELPHGLKAERQTLEIRERLLPEPEGAVVTTETSDAAGSGASPPLQAPLRLEAPDGLLWQGHRYTGPFLLLPDAYGSWTLVEVLPLERYLEGVVPHEIGAAPAAALAAQAVLARSWALANAHRYGVDGFHLCASVQCQVYRAPAAATTAVRAAIASTAGQVLRWSGQPISAVYHASNGGVAADFSEAWGGASRPYLQPFVDRLPTAEPLPLPRDGAALRRLLDGRDFVGAGHPRFRWSRRLSDGDLLAAAGAAGLVLSRVEALRVEARGPSGRAVVLAIEGPEGVVQLERDGIRRHLPMLPSTLFVLERDGAGSWRAQGGGSGHGAGLSQQGAIELARRGFSAEELLQRYYPGAELR